MAPAANSSLFQILQESIPDLVAGQSRSPAEQAGYQLFALVACCIVPIIGGAITGLILRSPFLEGPTADNLYNDNAYWKIPSMSDECFENAENVHSISGQLTETERFNNVVAPK